jgi:two-component sensor histidine kinase
MIEEKRPAMTIQLVTDDLSQTPKSEILTAESNHRIANNLTLIAGLLRLQAADVAKAGQPLSAVDACLLLEEVGGRIETVGRLHRLLAAAGRGESLDLQQFLHDIAEAAIGSMSRAGDMTLGPTVADACAMAAQQALPVGFIVGELVTNSVKYAHPAGVKGRIELSCHARPEGAILIQITDDGVGMPENFDPRLSGGLGMRMVRMLADQLGANLAFDSKAIGLTVRLLIPPARPVSVE